MSTTYLPRRQIAHRGLVLAALALSTACSGASSSDPTPPATASVPVVASPSPSADVGVPVTPPSAPATDGDDLAGTPTEYFFAGGDVLGVVGVAADDVLNVRAAPGVQAEIVATLDPLADDVIATGAARELARSIWAEIEANGVTGWANVAFLAYPGATDDVTSEVIADLGETPAAETMLDLGQTVAETRASTDPPSAITVVEGPTVGDLGEITIDVIGLGDDAAVGLRLHVFGQPDESGDGFNLKSVEETALCGRGVTDDGACV